MIEIRYGEYFEVADLVGKSVAEGREQYQAMFDIPSKAVASVNGKEVKKKQEPERLLNEGDELSFEVKVGSKKPLLVGALMLALALTSGLFAYAYLTASITLDVIAATGDFATVTANSTGTALVQDYQPFGRYRGSIPAGILWDVTPATDFTGDIEVNVYLSNLDELSKNYSVFLMRFELVDSANATVDAQMAEKPLTLINGVIQFYWPSANYTDGTTYYIRHVGGTYTGLPWIGSGWAVTGITYDPVLFCEVLQAGLD